MSETLAQWFCAELDEIHRGLKALPAELADTPWRAGGWTRKQIVGHMMDSATNNRQRFVRASTESEYKAPSYAQEAWVAAHGYADQPWATLVGWWEAEHELLMVIVDRIPPERLQTMCVVGDDAPVTLEFLVRDYIAHQRGHLKQMQTGTATA